MDFGIAVAQVPSVKGDVEANMATHVRAVEAARRAGAAYVVFPELSLTGYEPELAVELAFAAGDGRLEPLIEAARRCRVYVVAGAPLAARPRPHIGAIIVSPAGEVSTYSKMNLHSGEDEFFSAGNRHRLIECQGQRIANAICADTNAPDHVGACVQQGATVYAAGVLILAEGYGPDTEIMEDYACRYGILVAMANHNRPTGGWKAIGKSAIWSPTGLLAAANETQEALVVARQRPDGWFGEVIELQ